MYSSMNIYIQPVNVKWFSIVFIFYFKHGTQRRERRKRQWVRNFPKNLYSFFLSFNAGFCVLTFQHFPLRMTMTMMAGELWLMSYTASLPMVEVKMVFMCNRGNKWWTAANCWKKWEGFFSYKLWWWRMKADCVCGRAFWQQISTQPSTNFTPTARRWREWDIYFLIDSSWMLLLLLAVRQMNEIEMYLRHSRRRKLWLTWNTMFNTHQAIDEPMSKSSQRHGHKNTEKM